jgi:hypothetical protein
MNHYSLPKSARYGFEAINLRFVADLAEAKFAAKSRAGQIGGKTPKPFAAEIGRRFGGRKKRIGTEKGERNINKITPGTEK